MKATKLGKRPKLAPSTRTFATHKFSLIYSGVEDLSQEVLDPLFEAGCDDATIGTQRGAFFLDFARQAPSFRIALASAIADVERSGLGLELIRVEPI